MNEPTLAHNLDVIHGTLERFMTEDPILNYAYRTYESFNTLFAPGVLKVSGKELKGFVTTGTVGNARFQNEWAADNLVRKNITKTYTVEPYKHCEGGMLFNDIEVSVNMDPEKIFDVVNLQWKKARAEVIDKIYLAVWTGMSSANDTDSMYSIFDWLSLGTQSSTGGFTGYLGRYNDGSTPGATFSKGGLACSSTVVPEFANYYADHAGNLDESLLRIINEANMVLQFKPPTMLPGMTVPITDYAAYTTKNVILTLNALYAKLNSNVGPQPAVSGYYPLSSTKVPGAIPLVWVDILDTARVSLYGTDPIVGINHNMTYPTYLKGWDFRITDGKDKDRHLVNQRFIDWAGQMWCESPRHGGYLISNHPSN